MFNCMFKRYKVEVLNVSFGKLWDGLKLYEKIFLVTVIMGALLTSIFSLLHYNQLAMIFMGIMFVSIAILMLTQNRQSEQKRIIDEQICPSARARAKKVVSLLSDFDIDYRDENQLDRIIMQAEKTREECDVWKWLSKSLKGTAIYVLIPIIMIILSEFFKRVSTEELLIYAIIFILICCLGVVVVSAFAMNISDILNSNIRNLNYFIRDLEDLKVFSKKIQGIMSARDDVQ